MKYKRITVNLIKKDSNIYSCSNRLLFINKKYLYDFLSINRVPMNRFKQIKGDIMSKLKIKNKEIFETKSN